LNRGSENLAPSNVEPNMQDGGGPTGPRPLALAAYIET
jgi:hypothetical protein